MSRPCSRATDVIFALGPTRIGTMMPACAASIGPRREDSSQGWATTVVAAGTVLALAISRSYLEAGGSPAWPTAARVPISLYFSVSMTMPPLRQPRIGVSRGSCLGLLAGRAKGQGTGRILQAEQAGDLLHPRLHRVGLLAAHI